MALIADHRTHRRIASHVSGQGQRFGDTQLQDFLHGALHALRVEVGDDNPRALARQGVCHGPPDPAGAADDDRDLA